MFLPYTQYGYGGHLGLLPNFFVKIFISYAPISFIMKFGFKLPNSFYEKQVLIRKSELHLA